MDCPKLNVSSACHLMHLRMTEMQRPLAGSGLSFLGRTDFLVCPSFVALRSLYPQEDRQECLSYPRKVHLDGAGAGAGFWRRLFESIFGTVVAPSSALKYGSSLKPYNFAEITVGKLFIVVL